MGGAACLHREDAARGGAELWLAEDGRRLRSNFLNSTLGVFGFEVKTEIASVRSGLDRLRFSRDFAVSRLKLFKA